eukprot:gene1242-11331_t
MGQKLNVVEDVLNHPDDEAKIKTVFKKFDKDNSGYLSEDEFNKFVHEVNSTLALGEEDNVLMFLRDFKQVDSNQDGQQFKK